MEAESVGVYRAKTEAELKLKMKIDKQSPNRKVKFLWKFTHKKLWEKVIFGINLFYHKQNQKSAKPSIKIIFETLLYQAAHQSAIHLILIKKYQQELIALSNIS